MAIDLSGLYVAASAIGVAYVTSHFALLQKREEENRTARAENEKIRIERLREHDKVMLEPFRQRIEALNAFDKALSEHYALYSSYYNSVIHQDDIDKALAKLVFASPIIYQISGKFNFRKEFESYKASADASAFDELLEVTRLMLANEKSELAREVEKLNRKLDAAEIKPEAPSDSRADPGSGGDGLLVRLARRLERVLGRR